MAHIYLFVSEKKRGPYSETDVRNMLAEGTITPETPYWNEEMAAWRPLGRIESLANKFRDPSTSIVPPRRPQPNGPLQDKLARQPLTPREKGLEIKKLSVRNQRITLGWAIITALLFFFALGAIFHLATLTAPDINAQWKAVIGVHR